MVKKILPDAGKVELQFNLEAPGRIFLFLLPFYFIEYSVETGDGHSVIGHWNFLQPGLCYPAEDILPVEHAGTTLDY